MSRHPGPAATRYRPESCRKSAPGVYVNMTSRFHRPSHLHPAQYSAAATEDAMQDRRESVRDKVFLGGIAEINGRGSTMDCVVRNLSETGACVELGSAAQLLEQC